MLNRLPACNKKAPSLQRKKYKTIESSKAKSKSLNQSMWVLIGWDLFSSFLDHYC